jgi:hypothetical protein
VGKPEEKRPLRRPGHRWVNIIKMELIQIGWGGMDCIDRAQDGDLWKGSFGVAAQLAASQEGSAA